MYQYNISYKFTKHETKTYCSFSGDWYGCWRVQLSTTIAELHQLLNTIFLVIDKSEISLDNFAVAKNLEHCL